MTRAVVCVATTREYQKGMRRLYDALDKQEDESRRLDMHESIRGGIRGPRRHAGAWPSHQEIPYGFKAFALSESNLLGADLLLWCDASILPIRSLEPLWERIERDGYWLSKNGWSNYEWTADAAYPDLFSCDLQTARVQNKVVPHVVATAFGLNVKHPLGKAFLDEYYRLASETRAFCGPWINTAHPSATPMRQERWRYGACGPADVRGHRHDQTAASVIAWRLGMQLSDPPSIFAYSKRRPDGTLHLEDQDERTILLADGAMETGLYGG